MLYGLICAFDVNTIVYDDFGGSWFDVSFNTCTYIHHFINPFLSILLKRRVTSVQISLYIGILA